MNPALSMNSLSNRRKGGVKPNLEVKIGKLKLKNPVIAASGTFGEEYEDLIDINSLGAIVTKTITLKTRKGNPPPRVCETPSGMLNSIGLENKGLDFFLDEKLPRLAKFKTPIIASIAGNDEAEFGRLARSLDKAKGVSAIELNLSCPNIKYGGHECLIAQDEGLTARIVRAVRRATKLTIIAKLSPNVTDITKIARAAEKSGADSVSLINTFYGMSIDIETRKPRLGNITGGLSGPAIRPMALHAVWSVYNAVGIPIIGMGGIIDYKDAIEFMLCGARAVQIGTANFVNPKTTIEVIDGIKDYLMREKLADVDMLISALKRR